MIQVENLTKDEREQILYNHIKLGAQPKKFKKEIKPFLPDVAIHQRFSPEIARRLGDPIFTKRLIASKDGLDSFVARPLELLREIIQTLDDDSRSALALVFMRGGTLPSPVAMTKEEKDAVTLIGGSVAGVRVALNALNGSLLIKSFQDSNHVIRFKHPTIADAFASLIAEDLELMDIYLAGTPLRKLFAEVSCGDVGIEGVKVIIPSNRYDLLISNMAQLDTRNHESERTLHWFLSYRCDREFLDCYIKRYPNFISKLGIGAYLSAVSDVAVIVRLHEYGLLPEQKRIESVERIRKLAVDVPDSGFLREEMRKLLTQTEFEQIIKQVRSELLPNLNDQVDDLRSDYNGKDDPESYFYELQRSLEVYRDEFEFEDDYDSVSVIDTALEKIKNVVKELLSELPDEPDSDDYYEKSSLDDEGIASRSVFDDVDI